MTFLKNLSQRVHAHTNRDTSKGEKKNNMPGTNPTNNNFIHNAISQQLMHGSSCDVIGLIFGPGALEVPLQLVHPDGVVHLPLISVQTTAGGAEQCIVVKEENYTDKHQQSNDPEREENCGSKEEM